MVQRQKDADASVTRVYKYGIVPIGPFPQEAIFELRRTNDLWNQLVALERQRQQAFEEMRRDSSKPYRLMAEKLDVLNDAIKKAFDDKRTARMKATTRDASNPLITEANAHITKLKKDRSEFYKELKPIRDQATKQFDTSAFNAETREAQKKLVREAGVYSHSAWEVLAYFKVAKERVIKSNSQFRFHRFDGSGFFVFRPRRPNAKVDGVFFDELFLGNKPIDKDNKRLLFISKDDSRKKTRIRMRATLAGGVTKASKVMHEFDLIYHRPIPEGGQIQNGKIIRTRKGDRFTHHLVLTVKQPKRPMIDVPKESAIGIDIGFRSSEKSIQVAALIQLDTEEFLEVFAPEKMIKTMTHVENLQSTLDDEAGYLGKDLKPLLLETPLDEDHNKYKLWRAAAKYPSNVTLSYETAYKLARFILFESGNFSEKAEQLILKWWKSNSRKYRELHNARRKQLAHRKHFYRQIASELVTKRQLISFEKIDLSKFAGVKDADNKLANKARAQRFSVSPSEFRDAIKNAADRENVPWVEVNPSYTSQDCSDCGRRNKELGSEKEWRCKNCGVSHDRDVNAAKNIAIRGLKKHFKLEK